MDRELYGRDTNPAVVHSRKGEFRIDLVVKGGLSSPFCVHYD